MIRITQEFDLPAQCAGPLASRSLYYERCHRRTPPERYTVSVVLFMHVAWRILIIKEYLENQLNMSLYSRYSLL